MRFSPKSIFCTTFCALFALASIAANAQAQTAIDVLGQIFARKGSTQSTPFGTASSQTSYQAFGGSAQGGVFNDSAVMRASHTGPDPYDPEVWRRNRQSRRSLARAAEETREASRGSESPLSRLAKSFQSDPQPGHAEEIPAPDRHEALAPPHVMIDDDGTVYDEGSPYVPPAEHDFYSPAGPECDDCEGSAAGVTCPPGSRCCRPGWICVPLPPFDDIQLGAGIDVFDRPLEANDQGDFGLHQSVNIGGRLPVLRAWDLGYQIGLRAEQSEITGSEPAREQYFFTTGIFCPSDSGLQWGLVYDHLSEDVSDFDDRISLSQVRSEVGYLYDSCREVGYLGMWGLDEYSIKTPGGDSVTFEIISQHLFFHRWYFADGSEGRLWAGFSNNDDGILGGDARLPLSDRVSLNLGFNFLIPEDDGSQFDPDGAWNVSVGLAWHIGAKARGTRYRPMFNVGGNGTVFGRIE